VLSLALGLPLLVVACPAGPRNLELYPDPARSPYRLPWKEGVSHVCIQGNNGSVSHHGPGEFAYDFLMPSGTEVLAARAGTVAGVKEDSDSVGSAALNNYVRIRHADGTVASYLHLQQDGALVTVGQEVEQGEVIARSGWTGRAALPHLHFHVRRGEREIPVTFREVASGMGVPRTFGVYSAGPSR